MIFNSSKILLHREFAFRSGNSYKAALGSSRSVPRHLMDHSRSVCVSYAMRTAHLLEAHLHRFDMGLLHFIGPQCTVFAAQALVDYAAMLPPDEISEPLADLEVFRRILIEMKKHSKAVDMRVRWMDRTLSELRRGLDPVTAAGQRLVRQPSLAHFEENNRPRCASPTSLPPGGPKTPPLRPLGEPLDLPSATSRARITTLPDRNHPASPLDSITPSVGDRATIADSSASAASNISCFDWDPQDTLDWTPLSTATPLGEGERLWKKGGPIIGDSLNAPARVPLLNGRLLFDNRPLLSGGGMPGLERFGDAWEDALFGSEEWAEGNFWD